MVRRKLRGHVQQPGKSLNVLQSDGGPQFISKCFQDFSRQWGFTHQASSPYYPQSNGEIEATVKCKVNDKGSFKEILAWDL